MYYTAIILVASTRQAIYSLRVWHIICVLPMCDVGFMGQPGPTKGQPGTTEGQPGTTEVQPESIQV